MLQALSSFWFNPEGCSFPNQEKGEKIVLLLRPHLVTLVPPFVLVVLLFLLPPVSFFVLAILGIEISQIIPARFIGFTVLAYYLFLFGFSFLRFLIWYFNIFLVTNERVIDFDFHRFLHKEISDCMLSKIQDVTSQMIGPTHTFFNYGHVLIQTAAETPVFEFQNVPHPDLVVKEISKQIRLEEAEPPGVVA